MTGSELEGMDMDTPVGVTEAAKLLGGQVAEKTLYRWAAEGKVPSVKMGGRRCFIPRQLLAWLSAQATGLTPSGAR
jgi:excisionase family DNA binding protein